MKKVANLQVGKPDVTPSKPSHIEGVSEGNEPGSLKEEPGIHQRGGDMAVATARRSTGINPKNRDPIDPNMPNLPPA